MKQKYYIWIVVIILTFTSCKEQFDYSPYIIDFDEENSNVNNTNIAKIATQKNSDNIITIAFTGDSHREYDEFEQAVNAINKLNNTINIDFAVHMGDIADFGLPKQYLWGNSYLLNLNVPYITILGNHDLVGNGGDSYSEMFGEYDFSFIYDSIKFVFLNTNSLEFEFNGKVPDINWLDSQLKPADNFRKVVLLFHVPPVNDEFDKELINSFRNTLKKYDNVMFCVHGHTHSHSLYEPYTDNMTYVGIYSVINMKFNLLTIENDKYSFSTYEF